MFGVQDGEKEGKRDGVRQANGHPENEELNAEKVNGSGPANGIYPLRSEDSGLGVSASPSEQHLSPGTGFGAENEGIGKEGEGMWRKGGSMDTMTQSLQDLLAFLTTR